MIKKKIILDCDPGHDDAVAIMLAVASNEIDLLGITCVGGNATLENTKLNALKICSLLKRQDIPIYAGSDKPLIYDLVTAEHVHGKSGLSAPSKIGISCLLSNEQILRALSLVFSNVALPPTHVIPNKSISSLAIASIIATASSCPGSQSKIIFLGICKSSKL